MCLKFFKSQKVCFQLFCFSTDFNFDHRFLEGITGGIFVIWFGGYLRQFFSRWSCLSRTLGSIGKVALSKSQLKSVRISALRANFGKLNTCLESSFHAVFAHIYISWFEAIFVLRNLRNSQSSACWNIRALCL